MKVFVTGATGYIGFTVATRFRRAGHNVFGLVRSEQKAKILAEAEIHPVMGDMQHPESYRHIAEQCPVIIHTASDMKNDTRELDRKTVETILETGSSGARPKTFIYTSGCWCIGDTGEGMADETSPLNPIDMVAWRVEMENIVLESPAVNGIVIRPGCVYGKQGGLPVCGSTARIMKNNSTWWATEAITGRWSMWMIWPSPTSWPARKA